MGKCIIVKKLYIALIDTPGLFASIIRHVIGQRYIHVAIGLDKHLDEAYSMGRRVTKIPIISGFEREDKVKILEKYPKAGYLIYSITCTDEQFAFVKQTLRKAYEHRFSYHYAVIGLPFILFNKPFYQKNHYTCTSYIGKLLEEAGIMSFNKDFSLITPKDFYQYKGKDIIFEGKLRDLDNYDYSFDEQLLYADGRSQTGSSI